jgi:hypothetical protein
MEGSKETKSPTSDWLCDEVRRWTTPVGDPEQLIKVGGNPKINVWVVGRQDLKVELASPGLGQFLKSAAITGGQTKPWKIIAQQ